MLIRSLSRRERTRECLVRRGCLDLLVKSHGGIKGSPGGADAPEDALVLLCVIEATANLARDALHVAKIVDAGLITLVIRQCESSQNQDIRMKPKTNA